jgi:type I restriction enzyme M protein
MSDIVNKLWGFCHTLRHDGIDYGDYVEQLTFLLFLKMADEKAIVLPDGCDWPTLRDLAGTALTDHYERLLRTLSRHTGILGDIYAEAQSRFNKPVNLKQLINLIDETAWSALGVDVKAEAYEGLLEKAASEGKKGAGQYFTPRLLIQSIVRCVRPDPREAADFALSDPACGTGGFLVAAEWVKTPKDKGGLGLAAMDRELAKRFREKTYFGQELVARPRRLALMNLFLHNIAPTIRLGDAIYEAPSAKRFDAILTNPPFGTRGANQAPERDDFTVSTSNKQLNFLQHVMTLLKPGGRAAVVLPDNCLFADQAGEVFQILCEECDLHTVLRLPRGTFTPYSQGVKANVIFFTKGVPWRGVWIYDARTNVPQITKKDRPMMASHFAGFEACYGPRADGRAPRRAGDCTEDRWRHFEPAEVRAKEYKLDGLKWLKEETSEDGEDVLLPEELAAEAMADLSGAIADLGRVLRLLEQEAGA